jgi:hypothetical protein
MKTVIRIFIAASVALLVSLTSYAAAQAPAGFVRGVMEPVSKERITIVERDQVAINLGQKDGVVKGDIGYVALEPDIGPAGFVGRCAVVSSDYDSAICELVNGKKEFESGQLIFFDPVEHSDAALFPVIMRSISEAIAPRKAHERLNIIVYRFFDGNNRTTGLSEHIGKELAQALSQKRRITLTESEDIADLVFYLPVDGQTTSYIKAYMKKANIDILLVGNYSIAGDKLHLTVRSLDVKGFDRIYGIALPMQPNYAALASSVLLTAAEPTKVEKMDCTVQMKLLTYEPHKDERALIVRREAAGNRFTELNMSRIDFSIMSPVDVNVKMDDENISFGPRQRGPITLSVPKGVHRLYVSFKRGYFFKESLLYTSQQTIAKEVVIDVKKHSNVIADIRVSPQFDTETIAFDVYAQGDRSRQVLRPIYNRNSEKTVETFKD